MTKPSPQQYAAAALAALLAAHPEVPGMTWSIDPGGLVHGANPQDDGHSIRTLSATLKGSHTTTTVTGPAGERQVYTQLFAAWNGARFEVWTMHPVTLEEPARPLGALVPPLAGGVR